MQPEDKLYLIGNKTYIFTTLIINLDIAQCSIIYVWLKKAK